MKIIAASDVGKVRANNEDNYEYGTFPNAAFCLVCDGMGGVDGGEIASQIAVETIKKQLLAAYSEKMSSVAIERMIESAFNAANVRILEHAKANGKPGMGTTAVLAFYRDGEVIIAHDGDSRAYIINHDISQITQDHTYVGELYRMGRLTKEQMESDSRKNIITRALGVDNEIDVELNSDSLEAGSIVLLCSDGLTNCLSDSEIFGICSETPFEQIPARLIESANEHGGYDNITVALMMCEEDEKNG